MFWNTLNITKLEVRSVTSLANEILLKEAIIGLFTNLLGSLFDLLVSSVCVVVVAFKRAREYLLLLSSLAMEQSPPLLLLLWLKGILAARAL